MAEDMNRNDTMDQHQERYPTLSANLRTLAIH